MAFWKRPKAWREHFKNKPLEMFSVFHDFCDRKGCPSTSCNNSYVCILKKTWKQNILTCPKKTFKVFQNLSAKNIKMQHLLISLHEPLIDIREDGNLLAEFQQKTLHNWWLEMKNNCEDLVSSASMAVCLDQCIVAWYLFSTPAITAIKTKHQNNLN